MKALEEKEREELKLVEEKRRQEELKLQELQRIYEQEKARIALEKPGGEASKVAKAATPTQMIHSNADTVGSNARQEASVGSSQRPRNEISTAQSAPERVQTKKQRLHSKKAKAQASFQQAEKSKQNLQIKQQFEHQKIATSKACMGTWVGSTHGL